MNISDVLSLLVPVGVTAAGSAYAMVMQMQSKNLDRDNALRDSINKLESENKLLKLRLDQNIRTTEANEIKIQKLVRAVLRIPESGLGDDSAIDIRRGGFKDTLY